MFAPAASRRMAPVPWAEADVNNNEEIDASEFSRSWRWPPVTPASNFALSG